MADSIFKVLILIGRPASGKSEIIDYLLHTPLEERKQRFHVGELAVLDDFPMLWAWFEEDDILEQMGKPRLHSDEQGNFKYRYLWNVLIERIGLAYHKMLRDQPDLHEATTVLVEFSRGTEHGGYRQALPHLPDDLLQRAGVVYVDVPFEESLRKNRRRFNPERPDSILEHGLPDERLQRLYGEVDWEELSARNAQFLRIGNVQVPYAVFENQDDVTSGTPDRLGRRLEQVTGQLWDLQARVTQVGGGGSEIEEESGA